MSKNKRAKSKPQKIQPKPKNRKIKDFLINLTYECLECLLKQAQSTAKIYCAQFHKDSKESAQIEQMTCSVVKDLFKTLEDFQDLSLENLKNENRNLTCKDKAKLQDLMREFFKQKYTFSFDIESQNHIEIPPTMLAVLVYDRIHKSLNCFSPYGKIKEASIQKARLYKQYFLESLHKKIESQASVAKILEFAIRISVLGNVLDYGAQMSFDLEEQAQRILEVPFASFDLESFLCRLKSAKNLVMIGDNAGENEFDEILIIALNLLYPHLEIFYFVRGAEIINDITLSDLKHTDSAIFTLAKVVDSGVMSPGFIESLASAEAKEIYHNADVILAKGMGNFESMENSAKQDERIFLLFKIKCDVVKNYLQKNLGDFVFFNPNLYAIP
ncbi:MULTISPECIES: DUF89 domain-containing protein [Helicobacter]|uniref:Damage-control phosphatase ARMT1-like metal-binding domain-containing protein n=2 Tax=Helicobacter TaxID=209 RepID=A0A3D8IE28_9HELI|nr:MULTISPECIES: ARMT1-like domain-containing protein [Helicobacter]RDU62781.1 hypothetical protein CQA43_05975 [Helicobacter ganmani]